MNELSASVFEFLTVQSFHCSHFEQGLEHSKRKAISLFYIGSIMNFVCSSSIEINDHCRFTSQDVKNAYDLHESKLVESHERGTISRSEGLRNVVPCPLCSFIIVIAGATVQTGVAKAELGSPP